MGRAVRGVRASFEARARARRRRGARQALHRRAEPDGGERAFGLHQRPAPGPRAVAVLLGPARPEARDRAPGRLGLRRLRRRGPAGRSAGPRPRQRGAGVRAKCEGHGADGVTDAGARRVSRLSVRAGSLRRVTDRRPVRGLRAGAGGRAAPAHRQPAVAVRRARQRRGLLAPRLPRRRLRRRLRRGPLRGPLLQRHEAALRGARELHGRGRRGEREGRRGRGRLVVRVAVGAPREARLRDARVRACSPKRRRRHRRARRRRAAVKARAGGREGLKGAGVRGDAAARVHGLSSRTRRLVQLYRSRIAPAAAGRPRVVPEAGDELPGAAPRAARQHVRRLGSRPRSVLHALPQALGPAAEQARHARVTESGGVPQDADAGLRRGAAPAAAPVREHDARQEGSARAARAGDAGGADGGAQESRRKGRGRRRGRRHVRPARRGRVVPQERVRRDDGVVRDSEGERRRVHPGHCAQGKRGGRACGPCRALRRRARAAGARERDGGGSDRVAGMAGTRPQGRRGRRGGGRGGRGRLLGRRRRRLRVRRRRRRRLLRVPGQSAGRRRRRRG
mmetsp:Transcript_32377/g.97356  ORF Transcript_32377/g.97356 Transcript_32377/m.97356 type:complete len:565 (-) Transcript_32377:365-2059(-)